MQQFTLSGGEIVLKQNMSETIIGNHAAFINPKEIQWMKFHWCYDFFFFFFFLFCVVPVTHSHVQLRIKVDRQLLYTNLMYYM